MALARRQNCARIRLKSPKISRSQTKSATRTLNRPPRRALPVSKKPKIIVSGGVQMIEVKGELKVLRLPIVTGAILTLVMPAARAKKA